MFWRSALEPLGLRLLSSPSLPGWRSQRPTMLATLSPGDAFRSVAPGMIRCSFCDFGVPTSTLYGWFWGLFGCRWPGQELLPGAMRFLGLKQGALGARRANNPPMPAQIML